MAVDRPIELFSRLFHLPNLDLWETRNVEYDGSRPYLSDFLPGIVQFYQSSFREYWGLDGEEPPEDLDESTWDWYKRWDRVAIDIHAAASNLQSRQLSGWLSEFTLQDIARLLKVDDLEDTREFVEQRIEVELAEDFQWELEFMRKRVLSLLQWLVAVNSDVARRYLTRVADCYIKGLEVETVVMCGASLEAALEDMTEDEAIRKQYDFRGKYIPVSMRVKYLKANGMLPLDVAESAEAILKVRNDAVHLRMDVVPKNEEVIRRLAEVLDALAGGDIPGRDS